MATSHDVNFRQDGDVTASLKTNDKGNSCLTITSRRQKLQVSLTGEQADVLRHEALGLLDRPTSEDPTPPKKHPKRKAAKRKATKRKKASKKKKKK